MKTKEPEDSPELKQAVKRPRHVAIAANHLVIQRDKAIGIRDKSAAEVKELVLILIALGWLEA